MNNENMSFVFELAMILKISKNSFKSLNSFKGLPHRYEIFLKKRIVFLLMIQKQHLFKQQNWH